MEDVDAGCWIVDCGLLARVWAMAAMAMVREGGLWMLDLDQAGGHGTVGSNITVLQCSGRVDNGWDEPKKRSMVATGKECEGCVSFPYWGKRVLGGLCRLREAGMSKKRGPKS